MEQTVDQLLDDLNQEGVRSFLSRDLGARIGVWAVIASEKYTIHRLIPNKFEIKIFSLLLTQLFQRVPEDYHGMMGFALDWFLDGKSITLPETMREI